MSDIELNEHGNSPEAQAFIDESRIAFEEDSNTRSPVVNLPPSPEQFDVLYRDKLIATCAAFGIDAPSTAWERIDLPEEDLLVNDQVARYQARVGDVIYVFDTDRGMFAQVGDELLPIRSADDVKALAG